MQLYWYLATPVLLVLLLAHTPPINTPRWSIETVTQLKARLRNMHPAGGPASILTNKGQLLVELAIGSYYPLFFFFFVSDYYSTCLFFAASSFNIDPQEAAFFQNADK
jgi:hypothetical protein